MSNLEYKYPKKSFKDYLFDAVFMILAIAFLLFMLYAMAHSIAGVASR